MTIHDFRFLHPADDGGGSGNPPAEDAKKPEEGKPGDGDKPDESDPEKARLSREAANYRTKLREAEGKLTDLTSRLEELENAKLSESEREAQAKKKADAAREKAEREASEARRELMAFRAATRYEVPEEFLPALRGETQDEVDESAQAVMKAAEAWARKKFPGSAPNPDPGKRNGGGLAPSEAERARALQSLRRDY